MSSSVASLAITESCLAIGFNCGAVEVGVFLDQGIKPYDDDDGVKVVVHVMMKMGVRI